NNQPGLVVTYHETESDAQNGVNAVSSPYCNIDPGMQLLYVRVAHQAAPQCASFTTLTLIINQNPTVNPNLGNYELCDDNNPGDGIEGFDLASMDAGIVGGQANIVVTYHLSSADAQSNTGAIDTSSP